MSDSNGHQKDVHIFARSAGIRAYSRGLYTPPPQELTPELKVEFLREECRRLTGEMEQYKNAASTMANIALSFAQMLVDHGVQLAGDRDVLIPRWLSDRMTGSAITVKAPPGDDITVSIRDRARLDGAKADWDS